MCLDVQNAILLGERYRAAFSPGASALLSEGGQAAPPPASPQTLPTGTQLAPAAEGHWFCMCIITCADHVKMSLQSWKTIIPLFA